MEETLQYEVKIPLRHDGAAYAPGKMVMLDDKSGERLVKLGVVDFGPEHPAYAGLVKEQEPAGPEYDFIVKMQLCKDRKVYAPGSLVMLDEKTGEDLRKLGVVEYGPDHPEAGALELAAIIAAPERAQKSASRADGKDAPAADKPDNKPEK